MTQRGHLETDSRAFEFRPRVTVGAIDNIRRGSYDKLLFDLPILLSCLILDLIIRFIGFTGLEESVVF